MKNFQNHMEKVLPLADRCLPHIETGGFHMKPWLPLSIRTPDGEVVGHCTLFDENLIDVLDLGDVLLRLPLCLAGLLEAAGPWRWKGRGDS